MKGPGSNSVLDFNGLVGRIQSSQLSSPRSNALKQKGSTASILSVEQLKLPTKEEITTFLKRENDTLEETAKGGDR